MPASPFSTEIGTSPRKAKKVHGYVCQVCGFDFEAVYGPIGHRYTEAHHLTPLSELPEDTPVALDPREDFAVLCANCHRMMHRKDGPKNLADIRALARVRTIQAVYSWTSRREAIIISTAG